MFSSNYVVIIKCHLEMWLTTGPERPDNPIGPGCPRIVSCSEKVNGKKKIANLTLTAVEYISCVTGNLYTSMYHTVLWEL